MTRYNDQYNMKLHRDDHWIDTIRLCRGMNATPLLQLTTKYRYKTSGLSGDEWRTSTVWQCTPELAARMQGDLAAGSDPQWLSFDGPYGNKLETGCAALFPGIFRSQQGIHGVSITLVQFVRKGRVLYNSDYEGQALPLLMCAGHLPWALVKACDEPLGTDAAWLDMKTMCFQSGCAEAAGSTYRMKKGYRQDGSEYPVEEDGWYGLTRTKVGLIRRFCPRHLRRGDCGMDDCDANYEVLDGPGPEAAHGWQDDVSPAQTMIV